MRRFISLFWHVLAVAMVIPISLWLSSRGYQGELQTVSKALDFLVPVIIGITAVRLISVYAKEKEKRSKAS